ncbi:MAG TPA: PQQ-dependent sugar dehydrogenase [Opitutaceae bacterium]|nr:PQQ-dependent sugar dehydrogenase [Opitutaceae bacterium]
MKTRFRSLPALALAALPVFFAGFPLANAQPALVDSNLDVRTVIAGLNTPTSLAFLGANDLLVLEKATGKVQRVVSGSIQSTVLDLAVNSGSERGLLGIALHPNFPTDPGVYLFWTESSTGADTTALEQTPLLGNRVDRFVWNGTALAFDRNIILMRALQEDAGQPPRANHNGGILRFGPDQKLYIYAGDRGRRGQLQNLPDGPGPAGNLPDDQFGGPEPDNAHLTGVILRLNPDGTTPPDNPFFSAGASRGGEAGANLQKVFAYGIRNGFGMSFDPEFGRLWEAQNGDDSFTELNQVQAGANLGWVQVMGPLSRLAEFKAIETSPAFAGLQQVRWNPTNIADTPQQAVDRMFMVYDGGDRFGTILTGAEENPAVTTPAGALASFTLYNATIHYFVRATGPIQQVTMGHIHLGAFKQNGPIAAALFSFPTPRDFKAGDMIAQGILRDSSVIARPGFTPNIATLAERMRQERAYANVHTTANPGGEARGQILITDRNPVSHYSDPEFSWKFEVAPAALGFVSGNALGAEYSGNMIVGAARDVLFSGQLFRFRLTDSGQKIGIDDPRLADLVADNTAKYDVTESESLVFGTGFGVGTDIQTGPNGNLYVVSLTHGTIYEIFRRSPPATGQ